MTTTIHITATTVHGIDAFRARCIDCGWSCHNQPHDRQSQAVKCAKRHLCAPDRASRGRHPSRLPA